MEILKYQSVTSTNDVAKDLAKEGAAEWTVVLANEQTGGRGRKQRVWYSPPDVGIWMSIILRHHIPMIDAAKLGLVTALGITRSLRNDFGFDATIKWPNDVLIGGRKVSGILMESISSGGKLEALIIGIGINVNQDQFPPDLANTATSLKIVNGEFVPREVILPKLLKELEFQYQQFRTGKFHHQLREWRTLCPMLGQRVRLHTADAEIAGIATDVGDDGALILTKADGTRQRFFVGDVSVTF